MRIYFCEQNSCQSISRETIKETLCSYRGWITKEYHFRYPVITSNLLFSYLLPSYFLFSDRRFSYRGRMWSCDQQSFDQWTFWQWTTCWPWNEEKQGLHSRFVIYKSCIPAGESCITIMKAIALNHVLEDWEIFFFRFFFKVSCQTIL